MSLASAIRRWGPLTALAALFLDWTLPFGILNRFFHAHRWFPTHNTGLFAELLGSPSDPAAIIVVSASSPRFWVMGGLLTSAIWTAFQARRNGRLTLWVLSLVTAQFSFFILAEFLLPWMNEKGWMRSGLTEFLFPAVPRGHGRAFGWLQVPSAAFFLLQRLQNPAPPPA